MTLYTEERISSETIYRSNFSELEDKYDKMEGRYIIRTSDSMVFRDRIKCIVYRLFSKHEIKCEEPTTVIYQPPRSTDSNEYCSICEGICCEDMNRVSHEPVSESI